MADAIGKVLAKSVPAATKTPMLAKAKADLFRAAEARREAKRDKVRFSGVATAAAAHPCSSSSHGSLCPDPTRGACVLTRAPTPLCRSNESAVGTSGTVTTSAPTRRRQSLN